MKAFLRILILGLLAFSGACASGPAPDDRLPEPDERPVGPHDLQRRMKFGLLNLKDGVTPRQDVERIMGEPDRSADGGNLLVYHWMARQPSSIGKEDGTVLWHFLMVEFNSNGILRRHGMRTGDSDQGGPDTFDKAIASWHAASTRPAEP